ncbi:HDOD domain-containing protein [Breoghania sp.]|uniref:HDOD domain-containing protein n=1 Tax=Breoghania sp. TaxID=2065378 RepID=UPI0029C70CC6|nr:HDOD domain-containing protein [Breoghania sp.]
MLSLDQLLKESERIDPVPQVVHELMGLVEDPEVPVSEITNLITYEPVVTANLLKMANSAAFGLKQKVNSVHDAVVRLGLKQVVKIVLMASVTKPMKSAHQGYGLEEGRLWKQSVSCALVASAIAEKREASEKDLVFTAALLKDIGVIVLDRYMATAIGRVREVIETEGLHLIEAERRVLGIDHAELGGRIAGNWRFSKTLIHTIQQHHLADETTDIPDTTAMIYLADSLCSISGINGELFCGPDTHYDRVCEQLDLSETDLNRIMSDFYSRRDDIYGLLAIL